MIKRLYRYHILYISSFWTSIEVLSLPAVWKQLRMYFNCQRGPFISVQFFCQTWFISLIFISLYVIIRVSVRHLEDDPWHRSGFRLMPLQTTICCSVFFPWFEAQPCFISPWCAVTLQCRGDLAVIISTLGYSFEILCVYVPYKILNFIFDRHSFIIISAAVLMFFFQLRNKDKCTTKIVTLSFFWRVHQ